MKFVNILRHLPAWAVLIVLFAMLMLGYYIRPDNVTEQAITGVLSALLVVLNRPTQKQPGDKENDS